MSQNLRTEGVQRQYPSLPLNSDEIRLIRFTQWPPTSFDFELCTFTTAGCPQYTALSYTWGEAHDLQRVLVNHVDFEIRTNLHKFFEELFRSLHAQPVPGERWWWIDAICINQQDLAEKATVVGRMAAIFGSAVEIVVWLGPSYDASDRAMEFVNELAEFGFSMMGNQQSSTAHSLTHIRDERQSLKRSLYSIFEKYERRYSRKITDHDLLAYHKLTRRPWWKRAWIVQEATAAVGYTPEVWCGGKRSYLVAMALAAVNIEGCGLYSWEVPEIPHPIDLMNTSIFLLEKIRIWRNKLQQYEQMNPIRLLQHLRSYQASDPRDKVYAFVSMFDQASEFQPNYNLSWEEVYISFAVDLLLHHNDTDVFGIVFDQEHNSLPSWVPNWQLGVQESIMFVKRRWDEHSQAFHSLYNANQGFATCPMYIRGNKTLSLYGLEIDSVVSASIPRDSIDVSQYEAAWTNFLLKYSLQTPSSTGSVTARVLCADLDRGSEHPMLARRGSSINYEESLAVAELVRRVILDSPYAYQTTMRRRLITTKEGRIGLAPSAIMPGDLICIFAHCSMPMAIRRAGASFTLIGELYIDGIMDGEAVPTPCDTAKYFSII